MTLFGSCTTTEQTNNHCILLCVLCFKSLLCICNALFILNCVVCFALRALLPMLCVPVALDRERCPLCEGDQFIGLLQTRGDATVVRTGWMPTPHASKSEGTRIICARCQGLRCLHIGHVRLFFEVVRDVRGQIMPRGWKPPPPLQLAVE